jgi:hypothetical protein
MMTAVELLLETGNMEAAHDLFSSRLMTRGQHRYRETPADE